MRSIAATALHVLSAAMFILSLPFTAVGLIVWHTGVHVQWYADHIANRWPEWADEEEEVDESTTHAKL